MVESDDSISERVIPGTKPSMQDSVKSDEVQSSTKNGISKISSATARMQQILGV